MELVKLAVISEVFNRVEFWYGSIAGTVSRLLGDVGWVESDETHRYFDGVTAWVSLRSAHPT